MENLISNLTPDQEARLEAFREEWLAIGVCTDPADRPRAEAAIAALYRELGKKGSRVRLVPFSDGLSI